MGGYYAHAEGLDPEVADAIRDHYKPVGQGDDVPTAPVTVAVSLADKLDTLAGFFMIEERPTGSKDPFALRRAAIGVLRLIVANNLRMSIWAELLNPVALMREQLKLPKWESIPVYYSDEIKSFIADRLKVQQREAGVRHDLIDAVFALGGEDDLVRLLARVHALQAFVATPDGVNLLAGYKRAANILKKEGFDASSSLPLAGGVGGGPVAAGTASGSDSPTPDPSRKREGDYQAEPAEQALIDALNTAGPKAATAVAEERFADAMAALASLRAPIDAFFDSVTVNDADPAKRAARLALLAGFRDAVHSVADFSKIEG
jgi:glycyl-tRNA synthetase beta chain